MGKYRSDHSHSVQLWGDLVTGTESRTPTPDLITQRIADIIVGHDCCPEWFEGESDDPDMFWATHIAGVIVKELGLRLEGRREKTYRFITDWERDE